MKVKEISEKILPHLDNIFTSNGYKKYKQGQYLKIENDIVMYVALICHSKDLRMWHSIYPLFENEFNFGRGSISDRYPPIENTLQVTPETNFTSLIAQLEAGLKNIMDFQNHRSSITLLDNSILSSDKALPLMVKGICLAELGEYSQASVHLSALIDTGLNFGESRKGALLLIESFEKGNTRALLDSNKCENIKRLKLKKCF